VSVKDETYLSKYGAQWFWFAFLIVIVTVAGYVFISPINGHNGGTVFGYTTGTAAALCMLFLMYYARRKRSYYSTFGSLRGWLSAHVWIGTAVLFLVPFHSGFHFGWDVHTYTYALMALAVITGVWGAVLFAALPPQMQARRAGLTYGAALKEAEVIATDISMMGKGRSEQFHRVLNLLDRNLPLDAMSLLLGRKLLPDPTIDPAVTDLLVKLDDSEREEAYTIVGLAHKRVMILNQLSDEVRQQTLLRAWLYLHVPLAAAAFTALLIHIFSVFYRW
jgi:hypothetical protein